ncbi:MAG: hypothetical protein MI725_01095 [Pirellulales bacterium]|nr:hypothetical protein [Pirellulales bacterium]
METKLACLVMIVVFTCAVAMAQSPADPKIQVKGAKISQEADAKRIAFEHYIKKMMADVMADEGVYSLSVFKIGYDIPEFATAGDIIWQADIKTLALGLESKLRGIIWVHSGTGKVHFVTGAWDDREQSKRLIH